MITGKLAAARFDSEKAAYIHVWLEMEKTEFLTLSQAVGKHVRIIVLDGAPPATETVD